MSAETVNGGPEPDLSPSREGSAIGAVLFFDGECGLCNGVVRILIRLDRTGRLHYAPLQGASAKEKAAGPQKAGREPALPNPSLARY